MKRFSLRIIPILLLLIIITPACTTTKSIPILNKATDFLPKFKIFNNQGDQLKELVEKGEYEEAVKLYENNAFFDKKVPFSDITYREKCSPEIKSIAVFLNNKHEPDL